MKFQLTSHAVDRFCSRIAPGLSYEDGSRELAALLLRATRCGQTERGQAVYALPHDPPAYAVVKLRGKRRDPGSPGAVVVTVLTAEQCTASTTSCRTSPRPTRTSRPPSRPPGSRASRCRSRPSTPARWKLAADLPHLTENQLDSLWGRVMSVLEAERRRVEQYRAEISGVDDLARTLRAIGESLRHGQPDGALYLFEQWVSRREKSDMAAVAE